MSEDLANKKCVPCEDGVPPLTREQNLDFIKKINQWDLIDDKEIEKTFLFKDFKKSIDFINKISKIAEEEGHHPDFCLFGWNKVSVKLSTHSIDGLSDNDFILASKIDALLKK